VRGLGLAPLRSRRRGIRQACHAAGNVLYQFEFLPSAAFACAALDLMTVAPGSRFGRIYHGRYPDPPRRRIPAKRFGVLYLGSSLKVCFVEAVLRDQRNGAVTDYPIEERELPAPLYTDSPSHFHSSISAAMGPCGWGCRVTSRAAPDRGWRASGL
jgi:hypothetical protein